MMVNFLDTGCSLASILIQKHRSLFVCSVNAIRYFQWPYCSHIGIISKSCTYDWSSSFVKLEAQKNSSSNSSNSEPVH
jgi:hypothetical protein